MARLLKAAERGEATAPVNLTEARQRPADDPRLLVGMRGNLSKVRSH